MTFREIALNESMVKILIWADKDTKTPEERILPLNAAKKLGKEGLSHKIQILDDKDNISLEF